MKALFDWTSSLVRKVNTLIRRTEAENPGMPEVAAMVYVGDVYALREQRDRAKADGWGDRHYTCEAQDCKHLP